MIEIDAPKNGAWVRVESPDKKELTKLSEQFDLDMGHLHDAVDPLEVPRLEIEGKTSYLFTRIPVKDDGTAVTVPILIAYTEDNIITVSNRKLTSIDQWIGRDSTIITTQKTKLLLQILHHITAPGEHRPEFVVSDGKRRLWAGTTVHANKLDYRPEVRFPEQGGIL